MAFIKMATAKPAAGVLTTLYTIGAVSGTANLLICNTGHVDTVVRVAISATTTPTASEYIAYDLRILANGTLELKDLIVTATENIVIMSNTSDIVYRLAGNVA